MKALSLAIQKIWPMLKFLQIDRQTGQKIYAPIFIYRGIKMQRFTLAMGDNNYTGEFRTANVKNNKRLYIGMLR
jgi:hypothetical protein